MVVGAVMLRLSLIKVALCFVFGLTLMSCRSLQEEGASEPLGLLLEKGGQAPEDEEHEDNQGYNQDFYDQGQKSREQEDLEDGGADRYEEDSNRYGLSDAEDLFGDQTGGDSQLFGRQQQDPEEAARPEGGMDRSTGNMAAGKALAEQHPLPLASGSVAPANEFSGAPYIPGTLRNLAEGEAPEEYVVEAGDTLYDICDQLLGEGGFWPRLWSLNPYIKNPHFIWPGMRLRFYPGDEEDPPYIELVQEEEVLPVPEKPIKVDDLISEMILPKREELTIKPAEVIGHKDINGLEDHGFILMGDLFASDRVMLTLPGFIFGDQKRGFCRVNGGAMGETIVGEGQRFICQASDEGESPEKDRPYTALRRIRGVKDPETDEIKGWLYQFVSHIRLTDRLGEEGAYLGRVTKSRLGLQKGDIIVSYQSTRRMVSLSRNFDDPVTSDARIIAFAMAGRHMGGQGNMVFLNKGRADGVSPGQLMKIDQKMHYVARAYDPDNSFARTIPVGFLRIVDVTDAGSVGYIVYNSREIMLGDVAGKSQASCCVSSP